MKEVRSNLLNNEHKVHLGSFHWYVFIPGIALYIFSLVIFLVNEDIQFVFNIFTIGLAVLFLLIALVVNITKELTLTSSHVIYNWIN